MIAMIPELPEIINGVQFSLQNNVNLGRVTMIAMIPELPEIINGVQFSLQNNVNLG